MLAKTKSFTLIGLEGFLVDVEVDVSNGMPKFEIVGLPDASVSEAKERVRTAIKNSGKRFPTTKITVNLAPADIKKGGSLFDLPIAVGILKAGGNESLQDVSNVVIIGELSLDGSIRAVSGVLPILISAKNLGYTKFIIPKGNENEAKFLNGIEVYALNSLSEVIEYFKSPETFKSVEFEEYAKDSEELIYDTDLKYVKGQALAKRALEVAVAGGHNIIMVGPPGSGKTMLAKCIPTIMPDMTFQEALDTTKIHSVAGVLKREDGIVKKRPFMTPHHTASNVALIGGGQNALPGIISLAHNGVLYLDEMPEYSRATLECLRQPLEERTITVSRVKASVEYPANFILCGSMNPCPCGNYGLKDKVCSCTSSAIAKYRSKISGPLLDRIDIQLCVDSVEYKDLASENLEESSEVVRKRVNTARLIQAERFINDKITTNAQMGEKHIKKYCKLSLECEKLLESSFVALNLSARARSRIIKVARTIADLDYSEQIMPNHILEAVSYRSGFLQ